LSNDEKNHIYEKNNAYKKGGPFEVKLQEGQSRIPLDSDGKRIVK
jgi:hypothetical protein